MFENPVANSNPLEGFTQGFDLASRRQALQTKMQLDQQKLLQEQAVLALGQHAAQTGDPRALSMYSAVNPDGAKGLRENLQYFVKNGVQDLRSIKEAKITDRPAIYEIKLAQLKRDNPYFDASKYPDKYSPEVDRLIEADIASGSDLHKEYSLIETGNGFVKFNKDTGDFQKTGLAGKPNSDLSGGATGSVVRQIMRDNPGMNFTQALQLYQTGFRQGTKINDNGEIEIIPGADTAKTTFKAAEAKGTEVGKKEGELDGKSITAPATLDLINQAKKLLPQATSGRINNAVTQGANFAGISTKSSEADAQLDLIASNLTLNVPRMEGPQSDKDTELYQKAAAKVNDRQIPYQTRLAALSQLERLQKKYLKNNQSSTVSKSTKSNIISWGDLSE